MSYVLEGLLGEGVLFDFVVTHRDKLVVPEDAEQFSLSPDTWDEFVAFVAQLKIFLMPRVPTRRLKPFRSRPQKNFSTSPTRPLWPNSNKDSKQMWPGTSHNIGKKSNKR